jgi:hypothetical protein
MGADPLPIDHGRLHERVIDVGAVAVLRDVALRLHQPFEPGRLEGLAEERLRQFHGAPGILEVLHRFNP